MGDSRQPWKDNVAPAGARARWAPWLAYAVVLLAAPLLWRSGFGLSLLSQVGIAIVACLAYNVLLGQGGMLSFGHAVYSGLGAYLAIHTMNMAAQGAWAVPIVLVPLAGGLAGLGVAAVFGAVSLRRAGTPFAMITLGIGEMVWAAALMVPEVFGGEGGISADRAAAPPALGADFGPQWQVALLISVYCLACTAAMYAWTRTPAGRLLNAVRDNPERVAFLGASPVRVRYLAFLVSGLFSGIAGGLAAVNFEIVTPEVLGASRSATLLLFVFLGGSGAFFGPILGAVLMVFSMVLLSSWTPAWLLYLGLAFMVMVMVAPGGLAGLYLAHRRLAARVRGSELAVTYLALAVAGGAALLGLAAMIEMAYHLGLGSSVGPTKRFLGVALDTRGAHAWAGAALLALAGAALLRLAARRLARQRREAPASKPRDASSDGPIPGGQAGGRW